MTGMVGMNDPFAQLKGQRGNGWEFGTNTGRQGTFNPKDLGQSRMAVQRLKELQGTYGDRLQPDFTGYTGLAKNDAQGYSDMLNARTEAMNIQRMFGGQGPMNIHYGGEMPSQMPRPQQPPQQPQRQRSPLRF